MPNKNYRSGSGFEHRWCKQLLNEGYQKAVRFYASKGICDVYWVDKKGNYGEDQLKYSRVRKPKIDTDEFLRLIQYAMDSKFKVRLVSKQSRQPIQIWELN